MKKLFLFVIISALPMSANAHSIQDEQACQQIQRTHAIPEVTEQGATCQCDSATGEIFELSSFAPDLRLEAYKKYLSELQSDPRRFVSIICSEQQ